MHTNMKTKLVNRRARSGANPEESAALLDELIATTAHGDNLAMALHYQGFATERQAEKFVGALKENN